MHKCSYGGNATAMMPATTTTKGANCQALKESGSGADSGTDRGDRFIKGHKRKSMTFSKQANVKKKIKS